jgi:hypothetical protein
MPAKSVLVLFLAMQCNILHWGVRSARTVARAQRVAASRSSLELRARRSRALNPRSQMPMYVRQCPPPGLRPPCVHISSYPVSSPQSALELPRRTSRPRVLVFITSHSSCAQRDLDLAPRTRAPFCWDLHLLGILKSARVCASRGARPGIFLAKRLVQPLASGRFALITAMLVSLPRGLAGDHSI